MNFTKRNHYNPCFWTALWNPEYYRSFISGAKPPSEARSQLVYALSIKTGQIRQSSVEQVHYDKDLGVAEISRETSEDFVRRYFPDVYEQFLKENKQASYPVYIDFEDILQGIEGLPPYKVLLDVARTAKVESLSDKTYLALFVVLQQIRSHSILNAAIEWDEQTGHSKFETFVTLKWFLQDPSLLFRVIQPLIGGRWTLFATDSDIFPLCDSPVLMRQESVMVALSPRLLLEIQLSIHEPIEKVPRARHGVKQSKVHEFQRRTVGNTFREIIFGDQRTLEVWRDSAEFKNRVSLMKDCKRYNQFVRAEGNREIWQINAFGNME